MGGRSVYTGCDERELRDVRGHCRGRAGRPGARLRARAARHSLYPDSLRGRELMREKVPSYGQRDPRDITPETACPCPQTYFDPILMARVRTLPNVTVCTSTALESFRQDDAGVVVRLIDLA